MKRQSRCMRGPGLAALAFVAACIGGCATTEGPRHGEEVVFARSIASPAGAGGWSMTLQGRIFEPPEGSLKRQVMIDALAPAVAADPSDALFRARAGHFVSDSVGNEHVSIALGDRVVALSSSDAAGVFKSEVALSQDEVARLSKDGVVAFETTPTAGNARRFGGMAVLVPEKGVTVISDMDDTIKVTQLGDRAEAKANTFVRPFRPVEGMPALYRSWQEAAGQRIHFHLLSAGPWQMYEPLLRFTRDAGFPLFTWEMRSVDTTDPGTLIEETVHSDPQRLQDFKVARMRAFMARFPERHVVLVGDSAERDPEAYATILSEFPSRVDAVFIRDMTGEGQAAARYANLFASPGAAAKFRVFDKAGELPRRLAEAP